MVTRLQVFGDVASDADGSSIWIDVATGEDVLVRLVEASCETLVGEVREKSVC